MPHILLLEPDGLLAGSISDYLAYANYTVAAHTDPQEAITSADKQRPALVIMELQLAGRSGVEFLYEFRSYPDWQAIPIIIYTALPNQTVSAYRSIFAELKVSACLHKPTAGLDQLLKQAELALQPAVVR